ncbi:putative E3 ubiquitin-protein ligase ARI8-like [Hibiscus syriacus]|uniref:E3 ubiquitin-protein ligase ARI8-like n=1 Tax=Hibiscus syriacus TaxID=106335 RepID=A0A6A3BG64_HIBSY|nr:probable calcium-binding protein CML41 [Hibiscus syriacus]KAE8714408.1 putative E3 ubiquitin-protein ligase ARI8-like [Hibiscus syriacus]
METVCISKPSSKWFSNKGLRLSLPRLRSKPKFSRATTAPTLAYNTKEEALLAVFRRFDSDGDGKISSEELTAYFASIGDKISTEEAQRVIEDFDNNGDDSMEFMDFVKLMDGDNEGDDIREAFEMFEVNKGCGCITPAGLQQTLNRLGDVKSYEECVGMIRVFDLDGNGVLDFHEFQEMMKGEPCKIV